MKKVKDKYLVVGADFAGFPLKKRSLNTLKKRAGKFATWE